ncbi:MAG: protein phosphatase CheZ [Proteobacteria bacterium]|nr:protein phosphatase CheZ [Pseudomonadota bacterium]
MSDDLDALFDEISAQRAQTISAAEPAAGTQTTPAAEAAEEASEHSVLLDDEKLASDVAYDNLNQQGKPMYERLGGIVRLLHDSLHELGYDRSLSEVASQISDAQGRLEHVASLTEKAANKVLNTIDEGMPLQEELGKTARQMDERWAQLLEGKMSIEDFKVLAFDSKQFTSHVANATEAEKSRLLDIMMAQDFQDITGQLIKKIVGITQKVEHELAQLLLDNAPPELTQVIKDTSENLMQGPTTSALAQNDVDSLLEGLGF